MIDHYINRMNEIQEKEYVSSVFVAGMIGISPLTLYKARRGEVISLVTKKKIKEFVDRYEKEGKTWR